MSLAVWLAGAAIVFVASGVMGLAGFGIGLVSLALLPFVVPPATAVVLMTIYALAFASAVVVQLRRDVTPAALGPLVVGSVLGTPLGVWALAVLPPGVLSRLIGVMLIVAVVLEFRGLFPVRVSGRGWGFGAGALAGVLGGAVGTPGPPVIVYAATQPWDPRTMKANLQGFFVVNQAVIVAGYWQAGLLTAEVARLALAFALPAVGGLALGVALFARVDHARFRRIVFSLLFASGVALLIRG